MRSIKCIYTRSNLFYRDAHTPVVLGHRNEHIVIIRQIFGNGVMQVHLR